jgi:hypothetical protein
VLLVKVKVERDGRLSGWRLLRASGRPEIDDSIGRAFEAVNRDAAGRGLLARSCRPPVEMMLQMVPPPR